MEGPQREAALKKETFALLPESLRALEGLKSGDEAEVPLLNEAGERVRLRFRVTRNARLGRHWHYLFGAVPGAPGAVYRTVEFRLNADAPEQSTVAVYPTAPPLR